MVPSAIIYIHFADFIIFIYIMGACVGTKPQQKQEIHDATKINTEPPAK
jgi:hypothetical protein